MHRCVTVYKKVTVCIYNFVRACVCASVSVRMNNSSHATLSAEASAPDRGWNIHANLVGRGLMRDHRRPGEREGKKKCEETDGGTVWKQTFYGCGPIILHVPLTLKRECVRHRNDCVMCHSFCWHLKKKMMFWLNETHIITHRLLTSITCNSLQLKTFPSAFVGHLIYSFHWTRTLVLNPAPRHLEPCWFILELFTQELIYTSEMLTEKTKSQNTTL